MITNQESLSEMDDRAEKMKCKIFIMKHMQPSSIKTQKNWKECSIGEIWNWKFWLGYALLD